MQSDCHNIAILLHGAPNQDCDFKMDTQEVALANQQSDSSDNASGNTTSSGDRVRLFEERDMSAVPSSM